MKNFVIVLIMLTVGQIYSQDIDKQWSEFEKNVDKSWSEFNTGTNKQWTAFEAKVDSIWGEFVKSTRKEWVSYSKDAESRSIVNFKDGFLKIETVVPVDSLDADRIARKHLTERLKKVFSKDNPSHMNLLQEQVKTKKGKYVNEKNAPELLKEHKIEKRVILSPDGVKRYRYAIKIAMLPDHLRRRIKPFKNLIERYSEEFKLEPALIAAIIHTESYFNPLAVSKAGACGLMQLMPRHGAREAYRYLKGEDRVVPCGMLFDPEINIRLGTAYIDYMRKTFFGNFDNNLSEQYLLIASYNWGPGNVLKLIRREHIDTQNPDMVYRILRTYPPKETREYVRKVIRRRAYYRKYFR